MKPLTRYAAIARVLVRLIDQGTSKPIDEVHSRAAEGHGLDVIPDGEHERLELSSLTPHDWDVVNGYFSRCAAHGKMSLMQNGYALLLAYCIEAMQQSAADQPQVEP